MSEQFFDPLLGPKVGFWKLEIFTKNLAQSTRKTWIFQVLSLKAILDNFCKIMVKFVVFWLFEAFKYLFKSNPVLERQFPEFYSIRRYRPDGGGTHTLLKYIPVLVLYFVLCTRDFDSGTTKVHRGTKMAPNTCFETSFSNIKRGIIFPVRFNEINMDFLMFKRLVDDYLTQFCQNPTLFEKRSFFHWVDRKMKVNTTTW